jgi:16S rRNA (guanine527-N7)-methyltransferase
MQLIQKYFPDLTENQIRQFTLLRTLYEDWNLKINVVSRKDVEELYLRHVLHSLGIARVISFPSSAQVLDVGTGGGFPGIPLAILFPETQFHLVDSIGKKIKVVDEVVAGLGLKNVNSYNMRVEDLGMKFDYIISRAVAQMDTFVFWTRNRIKKTSSFSIKNGIFYLKGGDLTEELAGFPKAVLYDLKDYFEEDFFETKKVVYLKH